MCMNKNTLITALVTIVSAIIFWNVLAEIVVYYEMAATGAETRTELADDLGLGILLFAVVPPGTLALSLVTACITRGLLKRYGQ